MRNYIILNNKSSTTISGLIIQELPAISKPLQRTQVETIDGRDGDIVTPLGYAAYNKKIKIGLYGTYDINEIIAYFATQGQVIFSNEPTKYYNYQIVDQIDYERLVRFKVATVTMHVQPFKYSSTEGIKTVNVDTSTVSGSGSEITLANTAEAPFTTLRYKGNATQTTYSGKNLMPMPSYDAELARQSNFRIDLPIGTYTVSFNLNSFELGTNTSFNVNMQLRYEDGTQLDPGIITIDSSTTIGRKSYTFTTTKVVSSNNSLTPSNIRIGATYWNNGGRATLSNIQIETGPTATAYEPYVGGIPSPNPDYPQDIKVVTGDSTITIDDGNSASQTYVIPFGDTYLAAIGGYADEPVKVDGAWYIRRAIGKAVFDGSENITDYNIKHNVLGVRLPISSSALHKTDVFCDYMQNTPFATFYDSTGTTRQFGAICTHDVQDITTIYASAPDSSVTTSTQFKTWLSNNPTTIYYILATPTDEAITDQDLSDALDEFYGQAHAYKGGTHILATADNDNAPAVLSVEVGKNNETKVTNAGNTISRPILTIYGEGNIGVNINDVEVLNIDLGDEGYITLDSVEMDAYKDSPSNLKNRLVTGDYSKLALNAGDNMISFSGTVTKYEISKYSRWL